MSIEILVDSDSTMVQHLTIDLKIKGSNQGEQVLEQFWNILKSKLVLGTNQPLKSIWWALNGRESAVNRALDGSAYPG